MDKALQTALDFMGATIEQTGGGCDAIQISTFDDGSERRRIVVIDAVEQDGKLYCEPTAPQSLNDGPVFSALQIERKGADGLWDAVEEGDPDYDEGNFFPTLRDALLDIYGPAEGGAIPEPLSV